MCSRPVWLSYLGDVPQSKSPVQFPARAHAWIVGPVPGQGAYKKEPADVSLPLFLPPFSSL